MNRPPPLPLAGVVEGFYGRPWTLRQRHQLFEWEQAAQLNAYLYAPKDDIKHRALWREPYDPGEAAELAELIADCREHGLQFIYAVAPGLDIRFGQAAETAALATKLDQVRQLGAAHFALLWDDIPAQLAPEDLREFGTAARAQADVTNRVHRMLTAEAPAVRMLFCPTVYCGRMARPSVRECVYLQEIGAQLDPAIVPLWTGPDIIADTISVDSIRELRAVLRRKPVIWDNLVANDYDFRRLYLGPYAGRPPELRAEIEGILLNPNCQFEANFIPVHTLGQYLAATQPASPRQAFQQAVEAWLPSFRTRGRHPLTRDELILLADLLYLPYRHGDRAQACLDDLRRLLRTPPADWGGAADRFEITARTVCTIYDKLTELADRDLLYALYPHVWELKELALLLLTWVAWRREHPEPTAAFASPDHRPKVFRGGFPAEIERLLPMGDDGRFRPT